MSQPEYQLSWLRTLVVFFVLIYTVEILPRIYVENVHLFHAYFIVIQLWGCTKQSNIYIIQRFQNNVLGNIAKAPRYVRKNDFHRDLEVDVLFSEIQRFAQKIEERLHHHEEVEAVQLLDNKGIVRTLQRKKPFELV